MIERPAVLAAHTQKSLAARSTLFLYQSSVLLRLPPTPRKPSTARGRSATYRRLSATPGADRGRLSARDRPRPFSPPGPVRGVGHRSRLLGESLPRLSRQVWPHASPASAARGRGAPAAVGFHRKSKISEQPACGSALATSRASESRTPDVGQPARRRAGARPIRLHSRREFCGLREKRSSGRGAAAVLCGRRAPRRPQRVSPRPREGGGGAAALRCLQRATARWRPAGRGLSRAAVSRPRRRRGWGGARLRGGGGAERSRWVGLKGAVGSIRPRRLKHRSARCLQRATARWRAARCSLSRQPESEERRACRGRSSRLGLSGCCCPDQQDRN